MGPPADSTRPESRPSEIAAIPSMPSMARNGRRCRGWHLEPGQLLGLAADRAGRRGRRQRIWFNDSTEHWPGRRWRSGLPLASGAALSPIVKSVTAQQGLLNERYQQGAEMLGSNVLAVRLGGIYALQRLAKEHPQQYHIQIMQILCAYARQPTRDECEAADDAKPDAGTELRQDVQSVMTAISTCHARQLELERGAEFRLDLRQAQLPHAYLIDANLSGANLSDANLQSASLWIADLSRTNLSDADLTGAMFWNAQMSGALFWGAKLFDGTWTMRSYLARGFR